MALYFCLFRSTTIGSQYTNRCILQVNPSFTNMQFSPVTGLLNPQGVDVATGHLLQTSNWPDVSEGEHSRKGT